MDILTVLEFCDSLRVNQLGNWTILGNERNGIWVRTTTECYEVLKKASERGWGFQKLLSLMNDDEDRQYISDFIRFLYECKILKGKQEEEYIDKVTFSITNRCNLRCIHCSVSATSQSNEYYSDEELFRVADEIISCSPRMIVITGGEPLMRKCFKELSKYIRKRFKGRLVLMTNATLVFEKEAKYISECYDEVSVSLDGYDEKTTDFIRGIGTFDRVTEAIGLLKNYGINRIGTSMIVTGTNTERQNSFKKLNKQLGTNGIFRLLAPVGRADKNYDLISKAEKENLTDVGPKESKEPNNKMALIGRFPTCSGMTNQFCVGSDGEIYPCAGAQQKEFSVGNISSVGALSSYISERKYKQTQGYIRFCEIQPSVVEECSKCNYSIFCTGCPHYMYLYKKNGQFEEHCKLRKKELAKFCCD